MIRPGGIDQADPPQPRPLTSRLTAAPLMRPENREQEIGDFFGGKSICGRVGRGGGNPRGWEASTQSAAQSARCHCYTEMPSITPICIIGFCIVWPRHIKVQRCIVDGESARGHCSLISAYPCCVVYVFTCTAARTLCFLTLSQQREQTASFPNQREICVLYILRTTQHVLALFTYSTQRFGYLRHAQRV